MNSAGVTTRQVTVLILCAEGITNGETYTHFVGNTLWKSPYHKWKIQQVYQISATFEQNKTKITKAREILKDRVSDANTLPVSDLITAAQTICSVKMDLPSPAPIKDMDDQLQSAVLKAWAQVDAETKKQTPDTTMVRTMATELDKVISEAELAIPLSDAMVAAKDSVAKILRDSSTGAASAELSAICRDIGAIVAEEQIASDRVKGIATPLKDKMVAAQKATVPKQTIENEVSVAVQALLGALEKDINAAAFESVTMVCVQACQQMSAKELTRRAAVSAVYAKTGKKMEALTTAFPTPESAVKGDKGYEKTTAAKKEHKSLMMQLKSVDDENPAGDALRTACDSWKSPLRQISSLRLAVAKRTYEQAMSERTDGARGASNGLSWCAAADENSSYEDYEGMSENTLMKIDLKGFDAKLEMLKQALCMSCFVHSYRIEMLESRFLVTWFLRHSRPHALAFT